MYRLIKNSNEDIQQVVDIYNQVTGRNRTVSQHQWEWFCSPYENISYIIQKNGGEIIGHHGLLRINISYQKKKYKMAKTENTVIKKGYGPLYPKNEIAMHKEYLPEFDVLMTTAARGVTRKIRGKLGYEYFADYVTHSSLIDFSFLLNRFRNKFIIGLLRLVLPSVNSLFSNKSINKKFENKVEPLNSVHLEKIEDLYSSVKHKYGFMQIRSADYLRYRLLNNPYSSFEVLLLYKNNDLVGVLIYSIYEEKLTVEDVLFRKKHQLQEMLNRLCNHARRNELAKIVVFTTLKNSILDNKYKYFMRRRTREGSSVVMLKNNIKDEYKKELKVKNFYFTGLITEGVR